MLSCCKCVFEYIGANLDHFQAENLQNVQKNAFLAKSSGSQRVKILKIARLGHWIQYCHKSFYVLVYGKFTGYFTLELVEHDIVSSHNYNSMDQLFVK